MVCVVAAVLVLAVVAVAIAVVVVLVVVVLAAGSVQTKLYLSRRARCCDSSLQWYGLLAVNVQ